MPVSPSKTTLFMIIFSFHTLLSVSPSTTMNIQSFSEPYLSLSLSLFSTLLQSLSSYTLLFLTFTFYYFCNFSAENRNSEKKNR
ncbi:hypothetical protein VIGAN_08107500 [Vigna angularis var. angularis]|uniref:Uncharacterized protein n=1 Tax=Vigna angularis var. angularis TaxID=157739 RepID=A0A0S3SNP3_PHAAN|nr:hypothetical protein VIGAN_08107500 [Vigna angularis var. angularis]